MCVGWGCALDAQEGRVQGLGKEKKGPRKLCMASQHRGSLVMAESLSFVLEGIHLNQLKSKSKYTNITSLFNLRAVKDGGFPEYAHRGKTLSAARVPSAHVCGAWTCYCVKCPRAARKETPDPSAKGPPCISLSVEGSGV